MFLSGREWSRSQLCERVGSISQLGGISQFEYCSGKAKGVSVLRVRSATGLEFSVLPEKGMDIVEASYKGMSLSWHSPVGVVHPSYYDSRNSQWLKTFPGGLLTTCGLLSSGAPREDEGESFGLHGAISNTPAEHVSWSEEWKEDELFLTVSGRVREARVLGPNLVMNRKVSTSLASRSICINDVVVNEGPESVPLMQLYHLNFGFPLLTDRSHIYAASENIESRTGHSMEGWDKFDIPYRGISERVYYHQMRADESGNVAVVLVADEDAQDFGVSLKYRADSLPQFAQWKMTGTANYVLALEPANCRLEGRAAERKAGTLQMVPPDGFREFALELTVLEGRKEVEQAIRLVRESQNKTAFSSTRGTQ
jgi:hypothetical protein